MNDEDIKNDHITPDADVRRLFFNFLSDEAYSQELAKCMAETSNLYHEGVISKKDVLIIEKAVDKISIPSLKIKDNLIAFQKRTGRNIALQGELMGPGIQGNREKLSKFLFNSGKLVNLL